ncbi:MAG: XTP/dITP diphosphatase [Thermofilum sp.]|jgi:XTP/dITP diphosphohydrolase|nr:XTP/dITP diphosphatase [Thermofilum sp.]
MHETLLIATKNVHKLREMAPILESYGFRLQLADLPKIEIQSDSLQEIVAYAAKSLPRLDKPVIVEDAGLFINALNGFPGPYSHYAYKTIGCKGILKLMQQATDRTAVFQSAIALKTPTGEIHVFTGEARGTITTQERGTHGFGFDPIFQPQDTNKTFAEMTLQEKNLYSHRAKAAKKLAEHLTAKA